jgi:NADH-quinone oxidoreductase subunit L
MEQLIPLIPLLPLIGFAILGLAGNKISKLLASIIGCASIGISFVLSLLVFNAQLHTEDAVTVSLFNWIEAGSFKVELAFLVDHLTAVFLLIVTGVGFLIHIYSVGYMHKDEAHNRFFTYLNLFIFFMLLLVMGNNYLVMFIGWEGVGLCSYLLIGFWHKVDEYNKAANKAFIMNRIGDLGLILGIILLFTQFGTLNFLDIKANLAGIEPNSQVIVAATMLLFIGAMGKSAQIPLHTWLPDAMAGPTPVSALIHAATMVTAGIYMVVRSNFLYTLAPITLEFITIVGLVTALVAATIALFQNDIKKVLAYSTLSQLGYMFIALGVGAYGSGVFHVMTHAFFKALLFLGAGSVIHAMSGEQNLLKMGGLRKKIPLTFITFLIGVLAISGFPFTSGFVSKDEILMNVYYHNKIYFYLAAAGAVITAFYMLRLLMLTFFGTFRGTKDQETHLHESPSSMTIPLIILAVLSALGGFIQLPHIYGGRPYFDEFMSSVAPAVDHPDVMLATREWIMLGVTCLGLVIVFYFTKKYYADNKFDGIYTGFKKVLANKYYLDEFYDAIITKPLRAIGSSFYNLFDKTLIDGSVNGVGKIINWSGDKLRYMQTGYTGFYMFAMVLSLVVFLIIGLFNLI